MFNTPIYIPSRSRTDRLHKGVLPKLPLEILRQVSLVVPKEQFDQYVNVISKNENWAGIVGVLDCPEDGISKTREWIGKYADQFSSSKTMIMMDDDLTDWATRIGPDTHKLRQSTPEDMIEMFEWVQSSLQTYAHVSISPRGSNLIRTSKGAFIGEKPLTMENVRTLRLLAYQTQPFLSVEHGRNKIMEDFDVNLQLLEKGHKNIQSYWWTQDQRQTALPGGCSDYRDLELHNMGARRLAELHPAFVKLREKENKSKVTYNKEFTKRTEVTCFWKKAYASSQREVEKSTQGNRNPQEKTQGQADSNTLP